MANEFSRHALAAVLLASLTACGGSRPARQAIVPTRDLLMAMAMDANLPNPQTCRFLGSDANGNWHIADCRKIDAEAAMATYGGKYTFVGTGPSGDWIFSAR